jgi:hypothetical protein
MDIQHNIVVYITYLLIKTWQRPAQQAGGRKGKLIKEKKNKTHFGH